MGSGTTGVAALNTGRSFVGIERDLDYFVISQRRVLTSTEAQSEVVVIDAQEESEQKEEGSADHCTNCQTCGPTKSCLSSLHTFPCCI
jgi:DNA modification methylase